MIMWKHAETLDMHIRTSDMHINFTLNMLKSTIILPHMIMPPRVLLKSLARDKILIIKPLITLSMIIVVTDATISSSQWISTVR